MKEGKMVIGIAADNYKINRLEEKLRKGGFDFKNVGSVVNKDITMIHVLTEPDNFNKTKMNVDKLVKENELFFKHGN